MAITLDQIKSLRKRTGVGVGAVKSALEEAKGNEEKAIEILRERGLAKGAARAGRATENGVVAAYIHGDGQIGVLIEMSSETDFASRSEDFRQLSKDVALHIAASKPLYITIEDIPQAVLDKEKEFITKESKDQLEGKPKEVVEKIIEGKLQKFYTENVLLEQPYVRDEKKKVGDLLAEALAKIGENVRIARFARFEIAQVSGACGIDEI
ncbi:elongation factor Ts [Candidatus Dojkabacteria bacterium]|nr:elongation factor Ts [Candidatus Dojkabacteria bacterium]